MQRSLFIVGAGALVAILILFVLGWVKSPVREQRQSFKGQLDQIVIPDMQFGETQDPEYDAWQQAIANRPKLWQPLMRPQERKAPPPALAQILANVSPTRTEIGSGASRKVQIRVGGRPDWYTVGQQINGCTIKEITDTTVLFSVVQAGQEYGIPLPRR